MQHLTPKCIKYVKQLNQSVIVFILIQQYFVADHILYDEKEIGTDSLSDYSAEDMFNSPGWEGEIDEI